MAVTQMADKTAKGGCRYGIVESLTDDPEVAEGLMEVVAATFGR